jgi:hypothetical protein
MSSSLAAMSSQALATTATTTITPKTPAAIPPAAPTPPPGQWTHPKVDEITQRQAASTFSSGNLQNVVYGTVFLLLTFIAPTIWSRIIPYVATAPTRMRYLPEALLTRFNSASTSPKTSPTKPGSSSMRSAPSASSKSFMPHSLFSANRTKSPTSPSLLANVRS